MALTLLSVVKNALLDESLPVVSADSRLLQEPLFLNGPTRPQLFRSIPSKESRFSEDNNDFLQRRTGFCGRNGETCREQSVSIYDCSKMCPSSMTFPGEYASTNSTIPYLVPQLAHSEGMKLVSQIIFKGDAVLYPPIESFNSSRHHSGKECEEEQVKLLRVRRWVGVPSCNYLVESFEVLRAPVGLIQSHQSLKYWRRITVQGTVFRAINTTSISPTKDFSLYQEDKSESFMRFLFYEIAQPMISYCNTISPGSTASSFALPAPIPSSTVPSSCETTASFASKSFLLSSSSCPPTSFSSHQPLPQHHQVEDQCTSSCGYSYDSHFSFFSHGEVAISDSITSVLTSTSASTIMDKTPMPLKQNVMVSLRSGTDETRSSFTWNLEDEMDEAESDMKETNMLFLWRKDLMSRMHHSFAAFSNTGIAAGWKRWAGYCHGEISRALIVHSIDDLAQYCGGSRKAVYAAVQYLDHVVAVTSNPIELCKEIYRRLECCNNTSKEDVGRETRLSSNECGGGEPVAKNSGYCKDKTSGHSPSAPRHRHSTNHNARGKCSKTGTRRRGSVFPAVSENNSSLNGYLIGIIGGCCMLGCKMEESTPVSIERLSKCLKIDFTVEEFLQLELILFEVLQRNLFHNSMEQVVEFLLFVFSGDDETLFCPPKKMNGRHSPSHLAQWSRFQEQCRFLVDITLRGLSPSETNEFDSHYGISCLDINPLLLGIAVVAYVARLYQILLPQPFLLLFSPEFRTNIKSMGCRELPLVAQDKCFALLQEFSWSAAKILDEYHSNTQNCRKHLRKSEDDNTFNGTCRGPSLSEVHALSSSSYFFSAPSSLGMKHSPLDCRSFLSGNMKNSPIDAMEGGGSESNKNGEQMHVLDIAIRYVHECCKSFRELCTIEEARSMRWRYPELMNMGIEKTQR